MDNTKLTLSEIPPMPVPTRDAGRFDDISIQKKEQAARDFESVLLGKLLDEVKNSIGDWGFEESSASQQMQGTFWMFLAQHLADSGGIGIWKDIYKSLPAPEPVESLRGERQTDKIDETKPQIDGII